MEYVLMRPIYDETIENEEVLFFTGDEWLPDIKNATYFDTKEQAKEALYNLRESASEHVLIVVVDPKTIMW